MTKSNAEPLYVIAICGVGMGSSLILRMTTEEALEDLGVEAKVVATDVSSARGEKPDVIIGQKMHTEDFEGKAPVVVGITNFTDKEAIKEKLRGPFKEQGWIE